jgi:purine-cytosine permease-like protein
MDSSNYQPPIRRSLSNEELEARVNQAMADRSGIEAVMELLVAQEALRAQEETEEANWLAHLEADGSPEALTALDNYRRSKPGYVAPVLEETEDEPEIEVVQADIEPVVRDFIESPEPVSQFSWPPLAPSTPVEPAPAAGIEVPERDAVSPLDETEEDKAVPVEDRVESTFSWFSNPEVQSVEQVQDSESALEPVGTESETEFERLLAAAAAEEELTVLEESEGRAPVVVAPLESNVVIPSDEHRDRGPLSQLFIWLGLSSTVLPIALVWTLIGFGFTAEAVAAVLALGYLASGTLIAVASISGKRSGLSTGIISRSIFGVWGNSIPLTIVAFARVALTALLIASFTFILNGADSRIPNFQDTVTTFAGVTITVGLIAQLVLLVTASALAAIHGNAARAVQILLSLIAFGLVAESLLSIPTASFSFATQGSIGILSLQALSGLAVVVFVNLTLWFALAPNISKAIPMRVRGAKVFGTVLIAHFLVPTAFGVLTVFWASVWGNVSSLNNVVTYATSLPEWARGALTTGIAISVIYAAMMSMKSATLDFVALFRFKKRIPALAIGSLGSLALLVLFAQQPSSQEAEYLFNVFVVIGALLAGWIGIYIADVSIRKQAYHELSLSRSYGLYKRFNILALLTWVLTLAVAFVTIPVNLSGFEFMGMTGVAIFENPAVGFVVTLLTGLLLTYAIRVPQIKKQEREVLALEARREQLNDIFIGTE